MSDPKPFLFLDSPRVGHVGHAFILAPDCPTISEEHLVSLSTRARASQCRDLIAVRHTVLQADTNRSGPELLICAGAIPDSSADIAAISEVLEALWKSQVSEEALFQDKVTKRAALIYEAPCMMRIAAEFYGHPKVQQVRWKTVNLEPAEIVVQTPISGEEEVNPIANIIRWLMKHPIFVILVIVAAIAGAKAFEETRKKPSIGREEAQKPTDSSKLERFKKVEFLASGEWPRVLKSTGGKKIVEKLPDLILTVRDEKKKLSEAELDRVRSVTTEIDAWVERFSSEFALGGGVTPGILESAKFPEFLKVAKDTNGKTNVAAWITDYQNQRDRRYPAEVLKQAKALDDFSSIVGNPPPEQLPVMLREMWHALDAFSKVPGEDQRRFKGVIRDELKIVAPPTPDGFETLTLKDAQRLGAIQRILGSGEFGLVVIGEAFAESEQKDWHKIKELIDRSMAWAKVPPENDPRKVLLLALGKSFGLTGKPSTGQ